MPKLFNIEAEWHMELKSKKDGSLFGHRVKVSVLDDDLSFYINGMMVSPPEITENKEWKVYTPKIPRTKNKRVIEFNPQKSKLWPEIKEACIDVVKEHQRLEKLDNANDNALYEKTSEDFNKQLLEGVERMGF